MLELGRILKWKAEMITHLTSELLPFWENRSWDHIFGGYNTQYDKNGKDTGVNEKSLLAHMRMIFSFSITNQYGYDDKGIYAELARKGVDFAISNYWDDVHGGFYWLFDRKNNILSDKKIIYGHSFAIYAFSTFSRVFKDPIALQYAEECFDLIQKYASETTYGGYFEMFERNWELSEPGKCGGDRKTLDVHMHLMEAFTALYAASGKVIHKRKILELIHLIEGKFIHSEYGTGIPQFYTNWSVAPQIKFNTVWGWDRFENNGNEKRNALNTTSYGHNIELFWLLIEAFRTVGVNVASKEVLLKKILTHAINYGVDLTYGGVYVEGAQDGSEVFDKNKEFWQQAEFLIGMLTAYLLFKDPIYAEIYQNIHEFVFGRVINHAIGEWIPLLSQEGTPIWEHMSHSWKINYHTIRSAIFTIERMKKIIEIES